MYYCIWRNTPIMKLLKTELEQIIKEEIDKFLNERSVSTSEVERELKRLNLPDPSRAPFAVRNKIAKILSIDDPNRRKKQLDAIVAKADAKQAQAAIASQAAKDDATVELDKYEREKAEKALEPNMSQEPIMSLSDPRSREEKLADAGLSTDNPLGIPMMPTKGKSKKRPSSKAAKQNALSKRTGRSVASIQKMFKELFPKNSRSFRRGKPDGQYGGETEKVIKAVQAQLGIKQDGLWGPGTEKAWLAADAQTKSIASSGTTTQQTAQAVAKKPAVPLAQLKAAADEAELKVKTATLRGGGQPPKDHPGLIELKKRAKQLADVYQFALQKSKANKQVAGAPTPQ